MNWNFWRRPFSSHVFLWMALGLLSLTLLLIAEAVASRERDQWVNHTLTVLQNLEHYEASILAVQVQTGDPDVWSDVEAHRRSADRKSVV